MLSAGGEIGYSVSSCDGEHYRKTLKSMFYASSWLMTNVMWKRVSLPSLYNPYKEKCCTGPHSIYRQSVRREFVVKRNNDQQRKCRPHYGVKKNLAGSRTFALIKEFSEGRFGAALTKKHLYSLERRLRTKLLGFKSMLQYEKHGSVHELMVYPRNAIHKAAYVDYFSQFVLPDVVDMASVYTRLREGAAEEKESSPSLPPSLSPLPLTRQMSENPAEMDESEDEEKGQGDIEAGEIIKEGKIDLEALK